jgi:hypothetical protein
LILVQRAALKSEKGVKEKGDMLEKGERHLSPPVLIFCLAL